MTSWVIPCNLTNYDVIGAFSKLKKINWKQSVKSIDIGHTVYVYVGKPVSAIKYKCKVNKVNLPKREIDDDMFIVDGKPFVSYGNYMEIELLEEYPEDCFSIDILRSNGLKGNIQGPRRADEELASFLDRVTIGENSAANSSAVHIVKDAECDASEQDEEFLYELNDQMIEITKVTVDGYSGLETQKIKPVYIDNIEYKGKEYVIDEERECVIYEGQMYFEREDGSKRFFSNSYRTNKNNVTYYKVNPVKIIYLKQGQLRIVNSDNEGLYCYDNYNTYPQLEITDREPRPGVKNYKDILLYYYELVQDDEATTQEDNSLLLDAVLGKIEELNESIENSNRRLLNILNPGKSPKPICANIDFTKYLNVHQDDIIKADITERMIINGGPGTGKTWTLIEKIIYMVKHFDIDAETIQVLCFSRAAVEVIRKRIDKEVESNGECLDIKKIDVRTFDSFATQLLYYVRESDYELLPEDYHIEVLNYEERIQKFIDVINEEPELISQCRHLVVDEVQDLVLARADMVLTMIDNLPDDCGVTLLGDACQAIYDYQLEDESKSLWFYKEIHKKGTFKTYSFMENHRQTSDLILYSDGYRKHILEGDIDACNNYLKELRSSISTCKVRYLQWLKNDDLEEYLKDGTVAVLTRNNVQALVLSGSLRKSHINHHIQRRLKDTELQSWIAIVFNKKAKTSYDYYEFYEALFEENIKNIDEIWEYLCNGNIDARIDTKDILIKIKHSGSSPLLYSYNDDSALTISTIHRSKGREYDTVLILNNLLTEEADSLEEHRVKYVAISRAKQKVLLSYMNDIYFKTLDSRRCYGSVRNYKSKKWFLAYFEIGLKGDINIDYFVVAPLQEWIRKCGNSIIGKEVYLSRQNFKIDGCFIYNIATKDDNRIIGQTTTEFFMELSDAIRKIKNLSNGTPVEDYLYPAGFRGIYISGISTEIARMRGFELEVEDYGGMTTWNTLQIEGYAESYW